MELPFLCKRRDPVSEAGTQPAPGWPYRGGACKKLLLILQELIQFSLVLLVGDVRWKSRLKEILRVREVFCDIIYGDNQYQTSLKDLDRYFFNFAMAVQLKK